jgi:hypothetical protein
MRTRRLTSISLLALALLGAEAATAQVPVKWQPSASDCQAAGDSLRAGVPRLESWEFIGSRACGATGIAAIATAIQNLRVRSVSDTNYLASLFAVVGSVREMTVLTEAIALAEAKSAPLAARVFGLMVMLTQHRQGSDLMGELGWAQLLSTPRGDDCRFGVAGHGGYTQALPMASDFLQRIAASADRIADDPTDNAVIRDLATCLRLTLVKEVPPAVATEQIQLEYVCGTVFRVRNNAAKEARLRYEVEATTEVGDLFVHENSAVEFIAEQKGTVRLLQNGVVIRSVPNGDTVCS